MTFHLNAKQIEAMNVLCSPARYILGEGGARSGKTFLLCRAIAIRAQKAPDSKHLIGRLHFNHCKASILHQTWPVMMRKCFPGVPYQVNKQEWYIAFENGAEVWLGGFDDGERMEKLLGQEWVTIYANEASQLKYDHIKILMTRLAQVVEEIGHDNEENGQEVLRRPLEQRFYIDLNPPLESHWAYKLFHLKISPEAPYDPLPDPENYARFQINPRDNAENLDPKFLASLATLPARARARFWDGLWGSATENALWTYERIEQCRVDRYPDLQRIVIGVDPSGTKGAEEDARSDSVGIVAAGLGIDGIAYLLEDATCQAPPAVWGKRVVELYQRLEADLIVAETNFGGAMVGEVIRAAASELKVKVNFREVTASRGKVVRAEPISTLYGSGDPDAPIPTKVKHVGRFPELEDQLCNFTTFGYMGDKSPDRADAHIWVLAELFPGLTRKVPRNDKIVVEGVAAYNPQRWG